jgi:hypothetical protein
MNCQAFILSALVTAADFPVDIPQVFRDTPVVVPQENEWAA